LSRIVAASLEKSGIIGTLILAISVIGFRAYVSGYGGTDVMVEIAGAIRSGKDSINSSTSFLQPLGSFSSISFVIGVLLMTKPKKKLLGFALTIASAVQVVEYLSIQKGRISSIFPVVAAIVSLASQSSSKQGKNLWMYIIGGTGLIAVFSAGQILTPILGRSETALSFEDTLAEFAFPMANGVYLKEWSYRGWGADFVDAVAAVLPQKLMLRPDGHLSARWTQFLGFENGEMPLDLVSYGWLQFGFIGVLLYGFLMGTIFATIETSLLSSRTLTSIAIYGWLWFGIGFLSPMYGDPYHATRRIFPVIIVSAIASFLLLIQRKVQPESATCPLNVLN
jgi:hypothetical protein